MNKKQKAALTLFLRGLSQTDIAEVLHVSEQSISKWKNEQNWERELLRVTETDDTIIKSLESIIIHNLRVIQSRMEAQEKSKEFQLIDRVEIEAIIKLFGQIKKKELEFADTAIVLHEFMLFVKQRDPKLAAALSDIAKDYINEKKSISSTK